MLPNFLIIGAMKCGTTALFLYLRDHPEAFMPEPKEPNFFCDRDWSEKLEAYERLFDDAGDALAVGEASTNYAKHPDFPGVPERIRAFRSDMKLVYLVRDPLERIQSHYQHEILAGVAMPPFDEAVSTDHRFIDWSRYAMQIERYLEHFPRDQLLVVRSESLRTDRAATLQTVFRFLCIDDSHTSWYQDLDLFTTEERRKTRPYVERLRDRAPFRAAGRLLPSGLRQLVRERTPLIRPATVPRPVMSDSLRRLIADELRDDVARLRRYMPPGFDGWGIA